ncbi:hypothetical protein B0T16DRAFT_157504 [Cercophora newfieldiana]|uniref:Uncharacterized protein n=1 Tax=Cercophora newfieldiana TaxID=92897 RepID=A0AA39Y6H2_9PEZI|nr:hypothetical protein B0T16DRAFT_157504 [Cercophora newfieldiana]
MKASYAQQGRNAFSSPSAGQPVRTSLPPPPDSLPPRPPGPLPSSVRVSNDGMPTPSRRNSAHLPQGTRGLRLHAGSGHPSTNPSHLTQVMPPPASQMSHVQGFQPGYGQYQRHPTIHPGVRMAGSANAPGWHQHHGSAQGWPANGQTNVPAAPPPYSYLPMMQHQTLQVQPIVAPWSSNQQVPPSPRPQPRNGQGHGHSHSHPYG